MEGFPNVEIEVGTMGFTSIVTDINGYNEIIIKGHLGYIIPVKEENVLYETRLKYYTEQNISELFKSNDIRELITARYSSPTVWKEILNEYKSQH
jgi:glycosyltransferase involved in cell wall biosynthesis